MGRCLGVDGRALDVGVPSLLTSLRAEKKLSSSPSMTGRWFEDETAEYSFSCCVAAADQSYHPNHQPLQGGWPLQGPRLELLFDAFSFSAGGGGDGLN